MCEFHEANPTVKQTEIGGKKSYSDNCIASANAPLAMFGVERRYNLSVKVSLRSTYAKLFLVAPSQKSSAKERSTCSQRIVAYPP
jgi:hypothetical protein